MSSATNVIVAVYIIIDVIYSYVASKHIIALEQEIERLKNDRARA